MGGSCSHTVDAWAHLATTDEIRDAVRGIEAWQKAQEQNRASGGAQHAATSGPLLARVGGLDVVKRVVEAFYRKLYGNEKLVVFLHDRDIVYLRAKQSVFMSWLFGPPNVPYTGKHLRVAHLRIIKQRGFAPEDYELGMSYFEESMRELGAPEQIIAEVLAKVRPFKDVIFTPCSRDTEEEARWAMEERLKEQAKEQELAKQGSRARITGLNSQISRNASQGRQCPFSGGEFSRQSSSSSAGGGADSAACPVAPEAGRSLGAIANGSMAVSRNSRVSITSACPGAVSVRIDSTSSAVAEAVAGCSADGAQGGQPTALQLSSSRQPSQRMAAAAPVPARPASASSCPYAATADVQATGAASSSPTQSQPRPQPQSLRSPAASSGGVASPAHSASSPTSSRPASTTSSFGVTAAAAAAVASAEARQQLLEKGDLQGGLDPAAPSPQQGVAEAMEADRSTDGGDGGVAAGGSSGAAAAAAGGDGSRAGVDLVDEYMSEVFGERDMAGLGAISSSSRVKAVASSSAIDGLVASPSAAAATTSGASSGTTTAAAARAPRARTENGMQKEKASAQPAAKRQSAAGSMGGATSTAPRKAINRTR